ncbi:MAG: hypothetical protein U0794_06940 [Isosphaeraceae bacterium]
MRLLVTIPHYVHSVPDQGASADGRAHGSVWGGAAIRGRALGGCLASLRQLFGPDQCLIDIAGHRAVPVNTGTMAARLDVVVCTTRDCHALGSVEASAGAFEHRETAAEPLFLGFECHAVLRERLGDYDYYAYMEDDLALRDPWFFAKLAWFNGHLGDDLLLQPNRYEAAEGASPIAKAYLDGDIAPRATARYQDLSVAPSLRSLFLDRWVRFTRPTNPHSGSFFLNARQMKQWSDRPDFLDRDAGFIGPLESAATLGVMKTFRVYKPAPENAAFLEVEHAGTAFLRRIKRPAPES